jgi:hypothetical protein
MTEECGICFDKFNGSNRKKCSCQYCQVSYCRECVGNWLTTIIDEPRCPNEHCKKAWSREYLDGIMTKVWRDSTYKDYREKLLMDRERALLPSTQPRIEAINEANRIEREVITKMRERRREVTAQIRLLQQEDNGIQTQIWDLNHQCLRMRNGEGVDEAAAKSHKAFVRRCPAEGCRGFLSTAWKCGVCELYSCSECHEVKGVARDSVHTCDPNNVETAKLIAKDTKACPKCGEMITKIDGCDQMWCVSCHTAFSWRTGQAASGVVHNPHFYEWQRRQNNGEAPRVIGDIPCGGLVDWSIVRAAVINGRTAKYPAWVSVLELAHRRISHVINVDMVQINPDAANNQINNIDLRISYLLKEINDDAMMTTLIAREKKLERDRELRRIYETLTAAAIDIFRRIIAVSHNNKAEADALRKVAEEAYKEAAIEALKKVEELKESFKDKKPKDEKLAAMFKAIDAESQVEANRLMAIADAAEKKIKDEENFAPLCGELDELRKFINEALDNLRRRYNSTIHGFDTNWERLSLKKKRDGEQCNSEEVEVKTIYGTFVEGLNVYVAMPIEPPTDEENGRTKFKKHYLQIRKLTRLINSFPDTGVRETQNKATRLLAYYEYCLNIIAYGSGTGRDNWQRDYYTRLRDRYPDSITRWQEHLPTLELTLKKAANTIT